MRRNVYEYSYDMKRNRQKKITRFLIIAICVIIFLTLFAKCIFFSFLVRSDSMSTNIPRHAAVFVAPLAKNPKRGSVVYLNRSDGKGTKFFEKTVNGLSRFLIFPQYFKLNRNTSATPCLRRVLALPGDSIYMKDYTLYVKPQGQDFYLTEFEITEKNYLVNSYAVPDSWDGLGSTGNFDEILLGKNEYFVLADNRIEAADSRVWGPIGLERIGGCAIFEYFPFNCIKPL